jgi:hypothetical protein
MAGSDRTQLKQEILGSFGSGRDVVNAALTVAQDAQRFHLLQVGATAIAANVANMNLCGPRLDRPLFVKEVRILPGGAVTANLVATVGYGYTNDNGATVTVMGSINGNTVANGGTGNWTFGTSIIVPPNVAVNPVVPSGSFMCVQLLNGGVQPAIPAGTTFQIIGEEV